MKRHRGGRAQVNMGIQAESVSAEVIAVGVGARAFKMPDGSPEPGDEKLRVLFLASNPRALPPLDLSEEMRVLERELRGVRFRDRIVLTMGQAVRPDDLVRLLRRERPTVVHFSGHGSRDGIVLQTDTAHLAVPGDILSEIFRDRNIQLVVLNSCFSESQAIALQEVVKAVVGTASIVGSRIAQLFTAAFYRTLGDGHKVKDAFRDGLDVVAMYNRVDVFRAYGDLDQVVFKDLPV